MLRRFSFVSRPAQSAVQSAALLLALLSALPAHAQLPEPVAYVLQANHIPDDALSALVLRDNQTVLSHLADRPMQAASTMKLVTTLVALERLGPVFRGRTELRSAGELHGDVLAGDLYVRGGADADFSTETLTGMLRKLRNAGIRKIDGRLIVDRQVFNPARLDLNVPPFDESPEAAYNVVPDAAMVNKNLLQIDMRSTGSKLKLALQPDLQGVTVDSDMKLVNAACVDWESGWKLPEAVPQPDGGIKVMLHGTFPKNCETVNAISVIDRQAYLDRLFRATWQQLGGSISGDTTEGTTPASTRLLADHLSRALPEIVRDTNKPSDNTLARLIFLSLGALEADPLLGSRPQVFKPAAAGGAGTDDASTVPTLARADAAVRAWMNQHGIDDRGLVLDNGSGLSRSERITPIQMGAVLQAGLRSNWAPEFQASIPIVAVDGTMRRRLHDSPAAGRARLKTGTLRNVTAIAGYVPDASGRQCVVVAFVNSELAANGRGRAVLDSLVDWVARLNPPPGAATPGQPPQPLQPQPAPPLSPTPSTIPPATPAPAVSGA
jgi:D-alanyl-D-alanine carboxypeptidase/D-alanyl-D-alanine-endopeptidase (penicillin-binding protein 4)